MGTLEHLEQEIIWNVSFGVGDTLWLMTSLALCRVQLQNRISATAMQNVLFSKNVTSRAYKYLKSNMIKIRYSRWGEPHWTYCRNVQGCGVMMLACLSKNSNKPCDNLFQTNTFYWQKLSRIPPLRYNVLHLKQWAGVYRSLFPLNLQWTRWYPVKFCILQKANSRQSTLNIQPNQPWDPSPGSVLLLAFALHSLYSACPRVHVTD